MTNRTNCKATEENLPFYPPRLARPRHRRSVLERAGSLFRWLTGSLTGAKGWFVVALMVLTTVSSWRYWSSDRSSGEFSHRGGSSAVQSATGRSASTSAKSVTLHTAQLETIEDTLTLTGTVVPENLLQITS
ncbi:MAG: hypothetical protein HC800_19030, partial [Phormidesmis sp. RL_2_1]|nr:hypothetical protein [Phormidesmis sp. RL_2_1]